MMSIGNSERLEVYNLIREVGTNLPAFYLAKSESDIERDEYGSIIKINVQPIYFYSHPTDINPTQKYLEKVGLTEVCDIVFNLSEYEVTQIKNLSYEDFDLERMRIVFNGNQYAPREKSRFSQFGDGFLYYIISGHKK